MKVSTVRSAENFTSIGLETEIWEKDGSHLYSFIYLFIFYITDNLIII